MVAPAHLKNCKESPTLVRPELSSLRFDDLRHHSITRLAEAGVPEQTLMAIAGHVSRKMLEHDSHIRVQAKRDAVSLLTSTWTEHIFATPDSIIVGERS
jgi:hypothetical protein